MTRADEIRARMAEIRAEMQRLGQEECDLRAELARELCPYKVGNVVASRFGREVRLYVVKAIYGDEARGWRAPCMEVTADGREGEVRSMLDGSGAHGETNWLHAESLSAL